MINYLQAIRLYFKCKKEKPKIVKKNTPEYEQIMKIKNNTNCPNKINSKICHCK